MASEEGSVGGTSGQAVRGSQELTKAEQFVLKEYEEAADITHHIDHLRNSVTGFFLVFVGAAGTGLGFLAKESGAVRQSAAAPFFSEDSIGFLLLFVALLGVPVVAILARLRSTQLEHFRIINNIREHFLASQPELLAVVELSAATLPTHPSRRSGTYYWTSLVFLLDAGLVGTATYLLATEFLVPLAIWVVPLFASLFSVVLLDRLYLSLARPRGKGEGWKV